MDNPFALVGLRPQREPAPAGGQGRSRRMRRLPLASLIFLTALLLLCLLADVLAPGDPAYMDLSAASQPPGGAHPLGTDALGRDVLAMILHGGRTSLFIGICSAAISALVGSVYGSAAALCPGWLHDLLMRGAELLLSLPGILLAILLQAALGPASPLTLCLVIGLTSWMEIAKVVRSEVLQMRNQEYILSARSMGAGFFYLLWRHLLPGFFSSIAFLVVSGVGAAIGMEATLSFLGIGLPVEAVSWGSLLQASQRSLLSGDWWMILLPGAVLLCFLQAGSALRAGATRRGSARLSWRRPGCGPGVCI